MFLEGIIFDNEEEKFTYLKYYESRGLGVYTDALNALRKYTGIDKIHFIDFMGFIRYDKRLRDVLYTMLATLEEYLKNYLFGIIDYFGDKQFIRVTKKNIDKFKLISRTDFGWNIYRNPRLDFGSIVFLYDHFKITPPVQSNNIIEDLKNINFLRNQVMHHRMLLVNQQNGFLNKHNIDKRVRIIKKCIISAYNMLQPDYNKGLISDINKANLDKGKTKSRFIYIDYLEGGYENDKL